MSYDINSQQVDIENLFKQNVNDLASIKELYRKLKELEEKITQIKYIDTKLADKLKKDYESLKKVILDENIQLQLSNKIDKINTQLDNGINEINTSINIINNDIDVISSQLDNNTKQIDIVANCVYVESFEKITPEIDDTARLQRAIDYAGENKLQLVCKGSNYFECSSTLNITKYYDLDFFKAYIKSNATIGININVDGATPTQCKIKNLMLDCENCEKGMSVNARRVYIENIYFFNINNIGLSLDGGYEIDVSKCNFRGVSPINKAIVINTTDNYIHDCYGTDNNIFVENNAVGNVIENCHAWIFTTSILPNSVFADLKVSAHVDKCIFDTYAIAIRTPRDGTTRVTGCDLIIHPTYYNKEIYSAPPMFIHFTGDNGNVYRTVISNNRISFPSKSETGYDIEGNLYNIPKELVMCEIKGNTGYYVDFCNGVKSILTPSSGNLSTRQSYAIRKDNRVSLKCYCAFESIPSTETIIFTLPEGMRPFQNFYAFGAMGTNIDNISKPMFVYIESNGNVKVKNASGDTSMAQGMVLLDFDVWQPGIS